MSRKRDENAASCEPQYVEDTSAIEAELKQLHEQEAGLLEQLSAINERRKILLGE